MSEQYQAFKKIIREAGYDNTYKMAWAKALVEISGEVDTSQEIVTITLAKIARKFIKYYWNQTIFFDLVQGSNISKPPVIVGDVKELINHYYMDVIGTIKPDLYERVEDKLDLKELDATTVKVIKALKENVSWRFLHLGNLDYDIYDYKKNANELYIAGSLLQEFHENEQDLFDLINYRWGLILETFNSSPKINKKVKIMDEREIKRSSLNRFKSYLDIENPDHTCFICGKRIEDEDLSIDHVIPWSYLYSDDIWNLVYVHKSCNSSKSNTIPSDTDIDRLKLRNRKLYKTWSNNRLLKKDKQFDNLELCIEHDYVEKFYVGCKG